MSMSSMDVRRALEAEADEERFAEHPDWCCPACQEYQCEENDSQRCYACKDFPTVDRCGYCGEYRGDPVTLEFAERWENAHDREYPLVRELSSCRVCEGIPKPCPDCGSPLAWGDRMLGAQLVHCLNPKTPHEFIATGAQS